MDDAVCSLAKIARTSSAFIYYISVTGVTGTKEPEAEAH
jgi:tryptophan synthase alpha subunit